jgi:hypothetical protein
MTHLLACAVLLNSLVPSAAAQPTAEALSQTAAAAAPDTPVQVLLSGPALLEQPLRGFYLEMRGGPGYALRGTQLPADPTFPQLGGVDEALGQSAFVNLAAGYELSHWVALQGILGAEAISGRREDRVRGLGLVYGGLGLRFAAQVASRWQVSLAPHILLARASTAVDPPQAGLGLLASVGADYFVHVRHFSLGVDLQVLVPLKPLRATVGLAPHVRYTF